MRETRDDLDIKVAGRMLPVLIDDMILHRDLFDLPKRCNAANSRETVDMLRRGLMA